MYRCMHSSPALIWSDVLYENTWKTFDDQTTMVHSDSYNIAKEEGGSSGENLALGYTSPSDAVDGWYTEI